jgi:hypothetical protein
MQATKAEVLAERISVIEDKVQSQHRLLQQTLVLLKNITAKVEAIQDIIFRENIVSEDDYFTLVDHKVGLRLKTPEEPIAVGDVVFASYKAVQDDDATKFFEEDGFPFRAGSGALPFDGAVIGKKLGETFTWSGKIGNTEAKGKRYTFTVNVLKVKTKIEGATDGDESGIKANDNSDASVGGHGHQEPLESGNPIVLDRGSGESSAGGDASLA